MKQIRRFAIILATAALIFQSGTVLASPVKDQLKTSIDNILNVLKDPAYKGEANTEKRRQTLRVIINERFSFKKMSQLSLGKYWKQRSAQEKEEFVKLFSHLLEDAYVSKIEGYTDEKVIFTKELIKKKKAQVNTKIVTDTVEIPIDYRLFQGKNGSWQVYDMVIEGVSLVGNYRSQFSQILEKDSYAELIKTLKKKIDN